MVRSRVYGILAGYEDQNDHDTLRHDPVFKLLADRSPEDDDLASQPTLSRFENAISIQSLKRLREVFLDQFIASFDTPPRHLTFDLDAVDDPAHGQQQLTFWHGYYDHTKNAALSVGLLPQNRTRSAGPENMTSALIGQLHEGGSLVCPAIQGHVSQPVQMADDSVQPGAARPGQAGPRQLAYGRTHVAVQIVQNPRLFGGEHGSRNLASDGVPPLHCRAGLPARPIRLHRQSPP
jgi:hypothetical protein